MRDFNLISGVYDPVKRLVFGNRLDHATEFYLDQIDENDSVLVIGGGTGRLLHRIHSNQIVFLDSSGKMVERAKNRALENVTFITTRFENFRSEEKFDWIVCPYFLDVFPRDALPEVLAQLKVHLAERGRLIVTDFQGTTFWQRVLIFVMYLFFFLTTQIRHLRLANIHKKLNQVGFTEIEGRFFVHSLIFSRIYTFNEKP